MLRIDQQRDDRDPGAVEKDEILIMVRAMFLPAFAEQPAGVAIGVNQFGQPLDHDIDQHPGHRSRAAGK